MKSKPTNLTNLVVSLLLGVFATPLASGVDSIPVTVDNFARAESDLYMGNNVKDDGFGKFHHNRTPTEIDKQLVIRMNRDTLYSAAVFDLDAGPVTIKLPDGARRFMAMQVVNEDQYSTGVYYGAAMTEAIACRD